MTDGTIDLLQPCSQEAFGELVGVSQQTISDLMSRGLIQTGQPLGVWLLAYCRRLRDQAAGRDSDSVLAKERAALSRSQRLGQDIKNAIAQKEYAPVGLLGDVLALASSAVVDRFDALRGALRKLCPDLTAEAIDQVDRVIAAARNEWIRATADLVERSLDEMLDEAAAENDFPADIEEEGGAP